MKRSVSASKEKWFSLNLYREGLHQLRGIGIVYFIILVLSAIMLYLDQSSVKTDYGNITILTANNMLCLVALVFTCIMVFYLFQFLNKRSSCDFYHALPHPRTCLFLSLYAAVLTWIFAGILLSILTSLVGFCGLGSQTRLYTATIVPCLLFLLAACFFLASVCILAMSLSGTILNSILATVLIAIAPRYIISTVYNLLTNTMQILPKTIVPSLFDIGFNPLFNMYTYDFFIRSDNTVKLIPINMGQSSFYSLIVGLIYTAVACIVFQHRHSEMAGKPASNRILQAVFRLTLTMMICLIPFRSFVDLLTSGEKVDVSSIAKFIMLYVLALCGYFLFELITTRKPKNLLRSIPALAILVVLNAGLFVGYYSIRTNILNTTPAAENIRSVTFVCNDTFGNFSQSLAFANQKIDCIDAKRIVSDRLKSETALIKAGDSTSSSKKHSSGEYYTIKIELSGKSFYRFLFITNDDMNKIIDQLNQNLKSDFIYHI